MGREVDACRRVAAASLPSLSSSIMLLSSTGAPADAADDPAISLCASSSTSSSSSSLGSSCMAVHALRVCCVLSLSLIVRLLLVCVDVREGRLYPISCSRSVLSCGHQAAELHRTRATTVD